MNMGVGPGQTPGRIFISALGEPSKTCLPAFTCIAQSLKRLLHLPLCLLSEKWAHLTATLHLTLLQSHIGHVRRRSSYPTSYTWVRDRKYDSRLIIRNNRNNCRFAKARPCRKYHDSASMTAGPLFRVA